MGRHSYHGLRIKKLGVERGWYGEVHPGWQKTRVKTPCHSYTLYTKPQHHFHCSESKYIDLQGILIKLLRILWRGVDKDGRDSIWLRLRYIVGGDKNLSKNFIVSTLVSHINHILYITHKYKTKDGHVKGSIKICGLPNLYYYPFSFFTLVGTVYSQVVVTGFDTGPNNPSTFLSRETPDPESHWDTHPSSTSGSSSEQGPVCRSVTFRI